MMTDDTNTSAVPMPRPRWIVRTVVPVALIGATIALLAWSGLDAFRPATDVAVMPVVTRAVQSATPGASPTSGQAVVQAPGWLEPAPFPTYITALEVGVVETVDVLEGQPVSAGEQLATLVDDDARIDLARAEARLARARAERARAAADHRAATRTLETRIEATRARAVAEAQLAELEASLQRAMAKIAVEEAKLAEVQDEFERKSALLESEAVSEAAVTRLQLRVQAQRAMLMASRAELEVLEAQRGTAQAELRAASENADLLIAEEHDAERAAAQLELAAAAELLAMAERDEAQLALDRMIIRAPHDGVVLQRLVAPGSNLRVANDMHAAHLFHLYDPGKLQVRVDVPLSDAGMITVGQDAEIEVEVLPNTIFKGRVARIVHEADIQKNTVEIKVDVFEPSALLKPEMLARVKFLSTGRADIGEPRSSIGSRMAVFIPESHVEQTESGPRVLVVESRINGRGVVAERRITLGLERVDNWVEIAEGLVPGDLIIELNSAPDLLRSGDTVRFDSEVG